MDATVIWRTHSDNLNLMNLFSFHGERKTMNSVLFFSFFLFPFPHFCVLHSTALNIILGVFHIKAYDIPQPPLTCCGWKIALKNRGKHVSTRSGTNTSEAILHPCSVHFPAVVVQSPFVCSQYSPPPPPFSPL